MSAKLIPEYPEETFGSRAARKIRTRCNRLTKEEREGLTKRAMELIYKGKDRKTR